MRLVVDLRRAFDSGLGTYIREVVPRTLRELGHPRVTGVIGAHDATDDHAAYLGDARVQFARFAAAPLSLAEQVGLPALLGRGDLFWATTLSHPTWGRARLAASVHDVAQIALPDAAGGSTAVKLASRALLHSLRRRSALLMFNSQFTRREFERRVGRPRGDACVTPLGVNERWYDAEPQPPGEPPYFLFVGNVRPHKNLALLLDAFEHVAPRLPHALHVVGQTEGFRTHDPQLLERLRRTPRVVLAGRVGDEALRQSVRRATALVLPSRYEGFGLPVLEGMAAGCPVIASDAGALPEVAGDAAFLFPVHDARALADLMLEAAAMTETQRLAVATRGRAHAQRFSWDATARLSAQALRGVLPS